MTSAEDASEKQERNREPPPPATDLRLQKWVHRVSFSMTLRRNRRYRTTALVQAFESVLSRYTAQRYPSASMGWHIITVVLLVIGACSCGGATQEPFEPRPAPPASPLSHSAEDEAEMCLEPEPEDTAPLPCDE